MLQGRRTETLGGRCWLAGFIFAALAPRLAWASGDAPALRALDSVAQVHYKAGRFQSAQRAWETYLPRTRAGGVDTAAGRVYALLSQAAVVQRSYAVAIDYARRALAQRGPHRGLDDYRAAMTLGEAYDDLRRPAEALRWFRQAEQTVRRLPQRRWQLYVLERLGMLLQNQQQYAAATPYLRQQLGLARRLHRPAFVGSACMSLGYGELKQGRFAAAQRLLDSATAYLTPAGSPELYPFLLKYQAEASLGRGQYARSQRFATQALAYARAAHDVAAELEAENTLAGVLDSLGQGRAALRHFQRSVALRDSLINLKEVANIAAQERRHDLDVQAGALRFNRRQNHLLRQQQQRERQWLRLAGGALLVIGGLLALYVRKYRQYRALSRQLAAAQTELQQQARLKELVLREMHHRVRNNFQTVISSLNLQAGHLADPAARRGLRESQGRVRAMALLHQALGQAPATDGHIALRPFTETLLTDLYRGHHQPDRHVTYTAAVAEVSVPLNLALPYALVVVELFLNALKHAFGAPHAAGTIRVATTAEPAPAPALLRLLVEDDGPGPALAANLTPGRPGSGLELVHDLSAQLGAVLDIRAGRPGLRVEMTFPLPSPLA